MKKCLFIWVALWLPAPVVWSQQEKGQPAEKQNVAILRASRSYNLTVAKLEPTVYVTLERKWIFTDHVFPKDLLAALKRSELLRKTEKEQLRDVEHVSGIESRYVQWPTDDRERTSSRAMLRYVIGQKHAELSLEIDLTLDHNVGKDQPIRQVAFGPLQVTVNLDRSLITRVHWQDIQLPAVSRKAPAVEVADHLQVSVTGTLDDKTRETLRNLARMLPDEGSRLLRDLWHNEFTNESHYGISLLWPDLQDVVHGLILVENSGNDSADFWYSISGARWPLIYVRRQLEDAGWPLVLRGHQYVGVTQDGVRVFRPVQFVLSKQPNPSK